MLLFGSVPLALFFLGMSIVATLASVRQKRSFAAAMSGFAVGLWFASLVAQLLHSCS